MTFSHVKWTIKVGFLKPKASLYSSTFHPVKTLWQMCHEDPVCIVMEFKKYKDGLEMLEFTKTIAASIE